MIDKLRLHAATACMWIGAIVAPREMRPILTNIIDAWAGIPTQKHQGRNGGIIMSPWWVNTKGESLARNQLHECSYAAAQVRQEHEARDNYLDELLYPDRQPSPEELIAKIGIDIPFVRNDEAYIYSPKTPLPDAEWRPADPAKPVDTEDALSTELCNWSTDQGLQWLSADEMLLNENLTPEQRCWLHAFIDRWEIVMERNYPATSN